MRFSIKKEELLKELQLLHGIVEKRNTMPILANILVNVTENEIELTGTDLEVGLKTHFPAQIKESGSITISGKKIFEIVRALPEEKEIEFVLEDDSKMTIKAGDSVFKVVCLPKDDYPQVPEPNFQNKISLPLDQIQKMIDSVYCAITQEQRYYLNGALMILKNDSLELVSTDGHRLAYTRFSVEDMKIDSEIRGIVSKKTLGELRKLESGNLEFDMDENNLFFRVDYRTLISRIIEGKFPNYEAVIPKENPNILMISRSDLANAIRRVSLLSTERSKGVKFNIEKNQLKLFSSNPEIGEARDRLDVEYSGGELEIGFNSQYVIDFLTTVESERIRMEFRDENSAVLMTAEDESEIEYKYVLMPMKI